MSLEEDSAAFSVYSLTQYPQNLEHQPCLLRHVLKLFELFLVQCKLDVVMAGVDDEIGRAFGASYAIFLEIDFREEPTKAQELIQVKTNQQVLVSKTYTLTAPALSDSSVSG